MGSRSLYVGNLPWTVGTRELREYFKRFGSIESTIVLIEKSTGLSKGYGFVKFKTPEDAKSVLNQKVHEIDQTPIKLNLYENKK